MTPTSEKNILKALAIGISAVMLMQPAVSEASAPEQETEKEQVESTGEENGKVESIRKSLADAKAELNGLKESAKGLVELAKINAYLSTDKETAKKCLKAAENVRNLKDEIDRL